MGLPSGHQTWQWAIPCKLMCYPMLPSYPIEHGTFIVDLSFKVVIFHSFFYVYQRLVEKIRSAMADFPAVHQRVTVSHNPCPWSTSAVHHHRCRTKHLATRRLGWPALCDLSRPGCTEHKWSLPKLMNIPAIKYLGPLGFYVFLLLMRCLGCSLFFPQEDVHMDIRGSYWKHVQRQECRKTKRYWQHLTTNSTPKPIWHLTAQKPRCGASASDHLGSSLKQDDARWAKRPRWSSSWRKEPALSKGFDLTQHATWVCLRIGMHKLQGFLIMFLSKWSFGL